MTITIELKPELQEFLRARAAAQGSDEASVAQQLLEQGMLDAIEEAAQVREAVRRGLEDADAGRTRPAAEVHARLKSLIEQHTR